VHFDKNDNSLPASDRRHGDRPSQPGLLKPAEAGIYLKVPENALAKMRMTGDGPPFVKIGTRVRYRLEALDEWIRAREYTSTSATSQAHK
jgi:hypothetical protein